MASAVYQQRKELGLCTRCGDTAADDSQFCELHRDAHRAYARKSKRRAAKRWRRQKLCVNCGKPRRKGDTSCLSCRINRARLQSVPLPRVETAVEKTERVSAATRKHEDGRERYHGQGKRGSQPVAQLNQQDLGMADQAYAAFKAGVTLIGSEESKSWTRGERERVVKATANQGERAGRHVDDVLERLGHFKQRHGRRDGE